VSSAADTLEPANPAPAGARGAHATPLAEVELPLTVIQPTRGWQVVNLRELWRFRELLYFLTWRDIKVRYKQTLLGAAWAVVQPFATMVVFSLFMSRLGDAGANDIPYPLFVFAGLLPWTFFANAIAAAGGSVVGNQNLVTKVYFPRLIIPISAAGAGLVDFAIAFGMLLVMLAYYGVAPGLGIVLTPVILLLLVAAVLGVGILLSALTVAYRDFRHVVPFLVQLWMFATPAIYLASETAIGGRWRWLLPLNPAHGLILNFRAALLGGQFDWYALAVSGGVGLVLFVSGCFYFRRVERGFADII
jgi:lipopolysaccharide transport system permease protein